MKHKVIALIIAAGLLGLVVGAVVAVHRQDVRDAAAHARTVASQRIQAAAAQRRDAQVKQHYAELNDQCHQGQASYDANTVVYKKAHARPVCDLQLVQ